MKKFRLLLLFVFCVANSLTYGQVLPQLPDTTQTDILPKPNRYPLGIGILLGVGPSSFGYVTGYSNMHELLDRQDISRANLVAMYTLGSMIRWKRTSFMLMTSRSVSGLSGDFIPSNERRFRVRQELRFVGFEAGYSLLEKQNRLLSLTAGIGFAGYLLKPEQYSDQATLVDFNALGNRPIDNITVPTLIHESTVGQIGIIWGSQTGKHKASMDVQLRLNYQFGFGKVAWQANNALALNAPFDRVGIFQFSALWAIQQNFDRLKRK
ncbi:MAG: hypothetical protein R2795_19700 [Saprospiraceae bacterium]